MLNDFFISNLGAIHCLYVFVQQLERLRIKRECYTNLIALGGNKDRCATILVNQLSNECLICKREFY